MSKIVPRKGTAATPVIVTIEVISDEPAVKAMPLCQVCKGTGKVSGLFGPLDCMDCHGTGVELRHAIGVIKAQSLRLAAAEKEYKKLKHEYLVAITPEGELERKAMDRFYAGSRINKND